ncbi:4,5-DOPA dioxygenase extradiol [Corticibacter populi]|uniref:4,5-DOPA dioxygenase extradiol n=2 Tax=Corticibacter populi TaxID=1550736 RepID=A0A3M6QY03_9BURK|nr:4,5-DOPA dioxygenase extradiol [Corticibacter populi]
MTRRRLVASLSGLLGASTVPQWLRPVTAATVDAAFGGLRPSARQPVLFVGHGSPMNVLPGNAWRSGWEELGQQLQARPEPPQLILCVSAHWLTQGGWYLTGMAQPRTIHDFSGFPQALYAQQYPAPGAPAAARALAADLHEPARHGQPLGLDDREWGLDHGAWSVLLPMFPLARIPVVQLSMDYARPLAEHYALGGQLRRWRERGVMIVGSGNIVHNLRRVRRDASADQAYDWAAHFDQHVQQRIARAELGALPQVPALGELMRLAHPSHEHYLPLLYAAGAAHADETPRFFNQGFQAASISMQSIIWG